MTKLKIDLLNGIIEAEGEESFVTKIYEDYKSKINNDSKAAAYSSNSQEKGVQEEKIRTKTDTHANKSIKRKSTKGETYKFLEMNGFDVAAIKELKDFYSSKSPRNGFERNAVFTYFLEKKKGLTEIGVNHIYTCHKLVEVPVPNALKQNLFDTANRKHWINTSNIDNIKLTTAGENLVEHTLPVKTK